MTGMKLIYTGGYIPDLSVLIDEAHQQHGWLFYRHTDGQWVSLADLKKVVPLIEVSNAVMSGRAATHESGET